MSKMSFHWLALAVIPLAAWAANDVSAATILADVRADYQTTFDGGSTADFNGGLGISDTAGSGYWNFYSSTTADPSAGTLSLLAYGILGNVGTLGYHGDGPFFMGAIAPGKIFDDGVDPGANEMAIHSNNDVPQYIVARWTAGVSGPIEIDSTYRKAISNAAHDGTNFSIYANGVLLDSVTKAGDDTSTSIFSLSTSILAGQHVDLVMSPNGAFQGDESLFSATITQVPEPTSTALMVSGVVLALGLRRRRR